MPTKSVYDLCFCTISDNSFQQTLNELLKRPLMEEELKLLVENF